MRISTFTSFLCQANKANKEMTMRPLAKKSAMKKKSERRTDKKCYWFLLCFLTESSSINSLKATKKKKEGNCNSHD